MIIRHLDTEGKSAFGFVGFMQLRRSLWGESLIYWGRDAADEAVLGNLNPKP